MQEGAARRVLRRQKKNPGTPGHKIRSIEKDIYLGTHKVFTMSEKKAIKIIKKDERARKSVPVAKGNTKAQTAREMVQTVTNWVNELQQKRRTETTEAIKSLLPKSPRPSEA
jgi:hypothetical protein